MNRPLETGTVALGVVGLLVAVSLAAHGGPPGTGSLAPRTVPVSLQDDFITLLAVGYIVLAAVVLVSIFARRPWRAPQESPWLRNLVSAGIAMAILTGAGYWALQQRTASGGGSARQGGPGQAVIRPRAGPLQQSSAEAREARFQWPLAIALGGLVALGAAAILIRERRGERGHVAEGSVTEELAHVVETTVSDLRGEADPRKAVIAAYAKMERILTSHGLPRSRSETQLEYLARLLTELEIEPTAIRTLTGLFTFAKFSRSEIDEDMRGEAIEALTAIQRDLRPGERVGA